MTLSTRMKSCHDDQAVAVTFLIGIQRQETGGATIQMPKSTPYVLLQRTLHSWAFTIVVRGQRSKLLGMSSGDLFLCSFPLYTIAALGNNDFYVAGGGGQAKTGVPNAIVSFLLLLLLLMFCLI